MSEKPYDPNRMDPERLDPKKDALNRTPDARNIGVAAGTVAGGAVAGAAVGAVTGPVGATVGAAIGAIAGGFAGKALSDKLDPSLEEEYWRSAYQSEPYYEPGFSYDDYGPAYRSGFEARARLADERSFDDIEPDLEADFNSHRANSRLGWDKGRFAAQAAYERACLVCRTS